MDTHGPRLLGGRYRLIEPLGAGGMGTVWRGFDEVLGRRVAVKLINGGAAFRARVRAEARAAARISHPHIAAVHDFGSDTVSAFVVMELVEGRSLAAALASGPLPWPAAAETCAQVAAALAAVHARGLAHRDVTPANIMLTPTGAKVVDFGVAAVIGDRSVDRAGGAVLGTPAYLAPERLGGPVGPAVDVYALGVVLYQAVTGELPWPGAQSTADLLAAHRDVAPRPLTGVPPAVARLYAACLAKDPAARPSSVDVARTLAAAAGVRPALADASAEGGGAWGNMAGSGTKFLTRNLFEDTQRVLSKYAVSRRLPAALAVVAALVLVTVVALTARPAPDGAADAAADPLRCGVRYAVRAEWGDGATVEVTISNAGGAAIAAWELGFELRESRVAVDQAWNASFEQDGRSVRMRGAAHNATLAPGGATVVGFNLKGKGSRKAELRRFSVNGVSCDQIPRSASLRSARHYSSVLGRPSK